MVLISLVCSNLTTKISKILETCKSFLPASEDFVNSATVFVNSATPRGRVPRSPVYSFSFCSARKMLFCKKSQKRCSFLLTSEEKEPKKTATPKPLHRGFNLFRGKTLSIKVLGQAKRHSRALVWLAKPVPYRASHILLNGALPHIYLIPCLNTEGFRGEQPLNNNPSA